MPDSRPTILAVDDDPDALERIQAELERRYGSDYDVVCESSADRALELLGELRAGGRKVAVVLADQWMPELEGVEFLARARDTHPLARRALLIDWGGWGDRPTAEAIFAGMAAGHMDYYVMKPIRSPDEDFHRPVAEFLQEWSRIHMPRASEITLVAEAWGARSHELRSVLARNGVPHLFLSNNSEEGRELLRSVGHEDDDTPVAVVRGGELLVDPSNLEIARAFGVDTELPEEREFDVAVIGGGPGGLTSAVYAASEGLRTLVIERESIGGQAGSSSLIRNYLGFSRGVSGAELAQRAYQQAWVFGTRFLMMRQVVSLGRDEDGFTLSLGEEQFRARTVVLATGVSYRRLAIPALDDLLGAGVYFGASVSEAQSLSGESVFVVGGGNSAGQAALHLARHACIVTLAVRGESLADSMSSYLRKALDAAGNVLVRMSTEVVGGGGDGRLDHLQLRDAVTGETQEVPARALFLLIGAEPNTGWLPPEVGRDRWGYVLTGSDLVHGSEHPASWPAERPPLPLETSVPGLFAVGDVRAGSTHRVAAAVGDGSVVVSQLHGLLESVSA